jgi:hypothetical protein
MTSGTVRDVHDGRGRSTSTRRILWNDTQASNGAVAFFLVVSLLGSILVAKGVLLDFPFYLIFLIFAALPGILTIRRVVLISQIVSNGAEVSSEVLDRRTVRGPWRGSRIVRVTLSYESHNQRFERRVALWSPERVTTLNKGDNATLLIDSSHPERFILRDLFVDATSTPDGKESGRPIFPVSSESLWPEGKLAQLQEFMGDTMIVARRTVVLLTKERLTIAKREDSEEDSEPVSNQDQYGKIGYEFYEGGLTEVCSYAVERIAKVELSPSVFRTPIAIWIADDDGMTSRVFKADSVGIPETFIEFSREIARQHILLTGPEVWNDRSVVRFAMQLLARELERQFRRVSPQAVIELKGNVMSEEDFRRIIR